ncbi:MAG: hypothetical protein GXN93_02730 [Candidatus Diapherotrites archaeon]|nr:hypothetical protein [Candidatus Diapherotrites archaeon]
MTLLEETLIRATRAHLRTKLDREPSTGEILDALRKWDDETQKNIIKCARALDTRFWSAHASVARRNILERIHPLQYLAIEKALEKWETRQREGEEYTIRVPLNELLLEEDKLKIRRAVSRGPEKTARILSELTGATISNEKDHYIIRVPANGSEEVLKRIGELIRAYTELRKGDDGRVQPLLVDALHTLGIRNPDEEITPKDLEALMDVMQNPSGYEKLKRAFGKSTVKMFTYIIDPRYILPKHIATFIQLKREANKYGRESDIVLDEKTIDNLAAEVRRHGFVGGGTAKPFVTKHMRVVAKAAKRQDGRIIFHGVRSDAVDALLEHMARTNKKIRRALEGIQQNEQP